MKYTSLILLITLTSLAMGQIAFEENFESLATGLDLTTEGYELSQNPAYTGTVTALVAESDGNKHARMVASPSGGARMQIVKSIPVEAEKIYTYELDTRGPYKRQIRLISQSDELLSSSEDYKPETEAEKIAWKEFELSFLSAPGTDSIKIGVYHNWSGTLDLDNFKVSKIGAPNMQTSYYVSSSSGDDENPGTKDAPWESLEKISAAFLFPGDSILFKQGDTLRGHFVVNGSGSEEQPILITAYGEGEKPVLSGQVGAEGGGDYEEAILVENRDNLIFDGLEIQNERLQTRSSVADTDASGIQVKNTGTDIMRNLVFRNMVFRNVYAVQPILDPDDFNTIQVSGLRFSSSRNTEAGKEKHIRDILVEDCLFANLQRFGIQFKGGGGSAGIGNDSINRIMNILIRNNEFSYNGGTGVLPNGTYNCLIENNIFDHPGASTDPRMPGRGSSIWNINCFNTIMQYNMCLSTRGYLDSYGIHIDNRNVNTFVQYNYMEDCEGGFVEILKGNKNAVYRFNVSVNDGWRVNETWTNSNFTIWVNADRWGEPEDFSPSDGVYIYNNTVVVNRDFTTTISLDGLNMFVYNNIFSSINGGGIGAQNSVVRSNDTPYYQSKNLYEGSVNPDFVSMDASPQLGDPLFTGEGDYKYAYQLQAGSPAMDNGANQQGPIVQGAAYGVFKDVPAYPNVDFYGNPIDLSSGTPNIGACNEKKEVPPTGVKKINPDSENEWTVYHRPAEAKLHIISEGSLSGATDISLCNLKGQVVQTEKRNILPSESEFDINLKSSIRNGIYILTLRGKETSHSRRIVLYQ